jgi:ribosomal protein S18 acetylase RimI-like enzyme
MENSSTNLATDQAKVIFRHITAADLPALEWEGEYTHFRRLYAMAYKRFRRRRAVLWVADWGRVRVIGQLFVQLNSDRRELADGITRAFIYSFRVRPTFRGIGVGSGLLKTAENDLVQRGFRLTTLNVARDNPDARRLYERMGYRVVAPEPGRWRYRDHNGRIQEVNEPSWRMEKALTW